jgi:hypothetical protein
MPKKLAIGILVGIGLAAFFSLWGAPVPVIDLLQQPLRSLWGTRRQLVTGVIEVSESLPVEAAARRLFKPFGAVRVTRRFSAKEDPR